MHKNNPKMAQKYWALIESGMSHSDASRKFQIRLNDGKLHNLNTFAVPNFTCSEEIVERPKEPTPDENGWFTIDSVPLFVPVDLYNCKAITPQRMIDQIIIEVEDDDKHRCLNHNSKVVYATHWRPATPAPAPEKLGSENYTPKYSPYKIEIICNGVTLKDHEYNYLIGEELDPYFARDVFKAFGFDKNDGWKKWQFRKIGNDSWVSWDKDFDAISKCWREGYTYRINPNLK